MKILVADDDKEILEALSIYLTQEGYEVETAWRRQRSLPRAAFRSRCWM